MLIAEYTSQFKSDLKLAQRRHKNLELLKKIMDDIIHERPLNKKYRDHFLLGKWSGHRELHIEPDWLLIYKIFSNLRVVKFIRNGTHSDLF